MKVKLSVVEEEANGSINDLIEQDQDEISDGEDNYSWF